MKTSQIKLIVISFVIKKEVLDELESFGIPHHRIINQLSMNLDTLSKLVTEIQKHEDKDHVIK